MNEAQSAVYNAETLVVSCELSLAHAESEFGVCSSEAINASYVLGRAREALSLAEANLLAIDAETAHAVNEAV